MKITAKQLGGYYKAHREWISQNDTYNKAQFGITKEQYFKIHNTIVDMTGNASSRVTLPQINKRLAA